MQLWTKPLREEYQLAGREGGSELCRGQPAGGSSSPQASPRISHGTCGTPDRGAHIAVKHSVAGQMDQRDRLCYRARMHLSFVAGKTANVYGPSLAVTIDAELERLFGLPKTTAEESPYQSDEIDYRGWAQLQKRASELGITTPHLTGVEAYQGGFLPADFDAPRAVNIPGAGDPLACGSLPRLIEELSRFAAAAGLPIDNLELMGLAAKYLEDDALFDQDLDIQTFIQLALSAGQARAHDQALWIVVR